MASPNRAELMVYPELHLCSVGAAGLDAEQYVAEYGEPLDGPRGQALSALAQELGIWLIPGSVVELGEDGAVYNTAVVYNPQGELVTRYRKAFPWRPYEAACRGLEFVTFDIPEMGRIGLSICYDAWFPEVSRHLAWMGAELIVNVVQTPTTGRRQEIPINIANAIVNQVWVASVNGAAPTALGRSLLVDPEGLVTVETAGPEDVTLVSVVDFDRVPAVRKYGTSGDAWPWSFFDGDTEEPLRLPLYNGYIRPDQWQPAVFPGTPADLRLTPVGHQQPTEGQQLPDASA